ncbi:Tripeptidyl-peptidase sed4 [Lachnellula hyalina]|uniref:tripeptidyl-peptidase II n=1 Tax=Lachnellula hyalina TaxID=1316788 RepID=A0A8H8R7H9_9HELO|nr:Tripeptidyl-peptidase sed4 [Lachnellula hyalina]TVY28234.1 Tripeptidyl-peptidase sed4 [Lachnellula hyalina]
MLSKIAVFAALLSPTLAAVHEQLVALPLGWSEVATPADDQILTLSIGLAQQNIDQLESKLLAVSTPGNAEYGQHLDVDDVNSLFAPTEEANTAVQSWLTNAGVGQVHSDGHWVTFATTVSKANELLNTTFKTYSNSGVQKIRTTQYSVPDDIGSYVDLITPTTYLGKTVASMPRYPRPEFTKTKKDAPSKRDIAASCQTSITPSCIKELYSVGNYTPDANSGSVVGFGSFLNQSALYADLFAYEKLYNIPTQNFSVILINNATNDQNTTTAQIGEADLDVQNIIGVSHPLPVVEFITGGSPPFIPNLDEPTAADNENEPYIPYYQYLLKQKNSELPQVISNSYGDDEQTVPKSYAIRTCNMIGMLGLRGITVLESSGDTGVGSPCQSNDGKKTPQFTPTFPGTCPYLLSVGGTQAVTPEVAWVAGSGGFSNYFSRAWYQEGAVQDYLNNHISNATKSYYQPFTNFKGRGFPDISAHSLTPDYQVIYDGTPSPSGGTSAAAPVVAGIIGLLNDARLRAGKNTLGFINPLLYDIGVKTLNDITGGGSVGCTGINGQTGASVPGASIIPYASWNSTVGWDPVTGLGTPNFQKLKELVLKF